MLFLKMTHEYVRYCTSIRTDSIGTCAVGADVDRRPTGTLALASAGALIKVTL